LGRLGRQMAVLSLAFEERQRGAHRDQEDGGNCNLGEHPRKHRIFRGDGARLENRYFSFLYFSFLYFSFLYFSFLFGFRRRVPSPPPWSQIEIGNYPTEHVSID